MAMNSLMEKIKTKFNEKKITRKKYKDWDQIQQKSVN